jgi:uncharacterized protein YdhG (YjbR/CyaY superfamily)
MANERRRSSFQTVEEYLAAFPPPIQKLITSMRRCIKKAAPEAEEVISYQMPAYKYHGMLVYFCAFKNHIGFYPRISGIEAFKRELSAYKGAKGSVQFPIDKPLPLGLIAKIVKFRVKENLGRDSAKEKIVYHKDGSLWAKGKSVNDIAEGYWEWFRKDGTKMRSGYFKKGEQVGEWITYDKSGKVYKVTLIKKRPK